MRNFEIVITPSPTIPFLFALILINIVFTCDLTLDIPLYLAVGYFLTLNFMDPLMSYFTSSLDSLGWPQSDWMALLSLLNCRLFKLHLQNTWN